MSRCLALQSLHHIPLNLSTLPAVVVGPQLPQIHHGRAAVHYRVWSAVACGKDPCMHRRITCARKDAYITSFGTISTLDWREDPSHLARRLSQEGTRECTEASTRLLYSRSTTCFLHSVRNLSESLGEKSAGTIALRTKISGGCEQLIWDFFDGGGQVVVYDANNGTRIKRKELAEKAEKAGVHIIFLGAPLLNLHTRYAYTIDNCDVVESMCDNEEIILSNIRGVKISSPDVRTIDYMQGRIFMTSDSTVVGIQKKLFKTTTSVSRTTNNTMSL